MPYSLHLGSPVRSASTIRFETSASSSFGLTLTISFRKLIVRIFPSYSVTTSALLGEPGSASMARAKRTAIAARSRTWGPRCPSRIRLCARCRCAVVAYEISGLRGPSADTRGSNVPPVIERHGDFVPEDRRSSTPEGDDHFLSPQPNAQSQRLVPVVEGLETEQMRLAVGIRQHDVVRT
jgi:hypothetical protein